MLRRGPKKTPGRAYLEALCAGVVEAAKKGETFPFIFAPPLGPLTTSIQSPLRSKLVASGSMPLVVGVLLKGAEHPNPAHA